MDNKTKYTVYFKNADGSHHSTKTMDLDGYIGLLENIVLYHNRKIPEEDLPYPTIYFEVEKREIIFKTI